jgi:Uncharacterised nucleotidyltransferase
MCPLEPKQHAQPELQLLLACARAQLNPAAAGEIASAAAQPLDWLKAIDLASGHGLSPVLTCQLQHHAAGRVPDTVRLCLLERFRAHTIRNFELTKELLEILSLFEESDVDALAFKGPVLSQQLYGDLSLREFLDLDIMVPTEAVGQVIALLGAEGFKPQFGLTAAQLTRFQKNWCEMALYNRARNILVEIHWRLFSPNYSFSPAAETAWEATGQVFIAQRSVTTLSIENQLLFACLHQAWHNWYRLGWVMDLAALVKQSPHMNWKQVQHRAGGFGTARMIRVSLRLIQNLFGAPLPSAIAEWVAPDKQSEGIARRVEQRLFSANPNARERILRKPLFRAAMESKYDRGAYWFHSIFRPTPLEWALLPLPDRLYPLYYPIRVGRLVCKHTAGKLLARRTALEASSEML